MALALLEVGGWPVQQQLPPIPAWGVGLCRAVQETGAMQRDWYCAEKGSSGPSFRLDEWFCCSDWVGS